jgi:hypothetical protein
VTAWAWGQDVPAPEKLLLLALAEQANIAGATTTRGVSQADLAGMVGATDRTVRSNLKRLEDRGVIKRWATFDEAGNRSADIITLAIDGLPDAPPEDASAGRSFPATTTTNSSKGGVVEGEGSGEREGALPLLDGVPDELAADGAELLRTKVKVGSRRVTPEEMAKALMALAEWNRQAGQAIGIGSVLKPIVGRIRERPSMDAAKHVRLVQSAWRLRWWERRGKGQRAKPQVIWGNAQVFEQVVQDAVDEARRANGSSPATALDADVEAEGGREPRAEEVAEFVKALRAKTPEDIFALWLEDLGVRWIYEKTLVIDTTREKRGWIEERFKRLVRGAAEDAFGMVVEELIVKERSS